MSDCYLCGAFIERGSGYRREVHTGTSARIYMTRWGGTSVGAQFGTRTVCATCADHIDRLRDGTAGRCLVYSLGYLISAYVGWQLLMNGSPGLGIVCLLGSPPAVAAWIFEWDRRSKIQDQSLSETTEGNARQGEQLVTSAEALGRNEAIPDWVERILSAHRHIDRRLLEAYAAHHPPRVGEPLETWVNSWPEWRDDWDPVRQFGLQKFASDETICSWVERLTERLRALQGPNPDKFRDVLIEQAKYVKPRVGETLDDYRARVKIWADAFDHDLDLKSPSSAIRVDESLEAWLARTIPIWFQPSDGESVEDFIEKITPAALVHPPHFGETADAWFGRFLASIDTRGD